MTQTTRSFDGLQSRLRPAPWGSHFRAAGRVSGDNVSQMIAAVVNDLAGVRPLVALCDYRAADMGATARRVVLAHKQSGVDATWPTALLVQPDQLEVWGQYAWLQAQRGRLKAVFTESSAAERWASDMAALQAAQARFRSRA